MTPLGQGNILNRNLNRQGSISSTKSLTNSLFNASSGLVPKGSSAIFLRPAPPLRPCLALGRGPHGSCYRSNRRTTSFKEDALILEVIEAYCSNTKGRNPQHSGRLQPLFILK